jgi:hypothetical protein
MAVQGGSVQRRRVDACFHGEGASNGAPAAPPGEHGEEPTLRAAGGRTRWLGSKIRRVAASRRSAGSPGPYRPATSSASRRFDKSRPGCRPPMSAQTRLPSAAPSRACRAVRISGRGASGVELARTARRRRPKRAAAAPSPAWPHACLPRRRSRARLEHRRAAGPFGRPDGPPSSGWEAPWWPTGGAKAAKGRADSVQRGLLSTHLARRRPVASPVRRVIARGARR